MPHTKDIYFMRHAYNLAKFAAQSGEVPIGAIVVSNNEILAKGWNCPISTNDPTAHAEIIALRSAASKIQNYRIIDATLYVTLEPCVMCIGAMIHARIKRLVFGAPDPKAGAIISAFNLLDTNKFNHKITYTSGILADECGKILQDFFKEKR